MEANITSMEALLEVGGSVYTSVEISIEVSGIRCTSMEVSRSFHGSTWKFKFPLSMEVEASIFPSIAACTNVFRGSFHELPYTPTYFPLLLRVTQTSSCFHKTSRRVHRLPFDLLPWKSIYFHGSRWMNIYVNHGNFHKTSIRLCRFPFDLLPWKLIYFRGSWN